jgi:hypothetical protein
LQCEAKSKIRWERQENKGDSAKPARRKQAGKNRHIRR